MIDSQTISTEATGSTQQGLTGGLTGKGKKGHGKSSLFSKLLANLTHKSKTSKATNPTAKNHTSESMKKKNHADASAAQLLSNKQATQPSTLKKETENKKSTALKPSTTEKETDTNTLAIATAQDAPLLKPNATVKAHTSSESQVKVTHSSTSKLTIKASTATVLEHTGEMNGETKEIALNLPSPSRLNHTNLDSSLTKPKIETITSQQADIALPTKLEQTPDKPTNILNKKVMAGNQETKTQQTQIASEQLPQMQAQPEPNTHTLNQANRVAKGLQKAQQQDKTEQTQNLAQTHTNTSVKHKQTQTQTQLDTNDAAQSSEQHKQQSNPIFATNVKTQPQTSEVHAQASHQASIGSKSLDTSLTSSQQDFLSNQQDTNPTMLDMSKVDNKSKNTDFQAQLAYKTQQSYTPHDAVLEIVKSAKDGSTTLELQLEPAHLGKVQVHIQTDAAKQLQVMFTVEHSASRQALEQQMPQLRLAMAQQGLDLGSFSMQMNQQQTQQQAHSQQQTTTDYTMADQANIQDSTTQQSIGVNIAGDGRLSILA